ncbi:hypothetical protein [Spirosoma pollinicola]|uniref:Uncharacterized protein n=1 Tax=Spirosoma pollinicola TaxID=2057025 RepID=A0A2K8ZB12_9BACT|nr:hypothetical protein [Spirosoma pollinicola]AUD07009.1 hypothetical protein CWM47_37430 [Spirosoma pollinicola]
MAKLNISPEAYYDLTGTETMALLKGVNDRELASLRDNRRLATLYHNANFTPMVTEQEFMPLPGDNQIVKAKKYADANPHQTFAMLASAMGVTPTIEANE